MIGKFIFNYQVEIKQSGSVLGVFNIPASNGAEAVELCEQKIMELNKDIEIKEFFLSDKKKGSNEISWIKVQWTGLEFFARRMSDDYGRDLTMN